MECEEARELVDAYALGALGAEARRVDRHLSRCAACRALAGEAAETAGSLALAAPLRRAAPALRFRLMARLGASAGRGRRPLAGVWAAAAAVLLAVSLGALGWAVYLNSRVDDLQSDNSRLVGLVDEARQTQVSAVATQQALVSRQRQVEATLTEQDVMLAVALDYDARPYEMLGSGPGAQATARYVWSSEHHLGVLYAVGLPPPPAGMTYQFWIVTEQRAVSGGTFAPEDDGSARLLIRDPPLEGRVVAMEVSLEPHGGSDAPGGVTVFRNERGPE